MLTRKSRGSECLGRPPRHCNSLRESVLNPEEIPLTSVRTTSDDTDQDDSPLRRPLFDTNERRRTDVNPKAKWYVQDFLSLTVTVEPINGSCLYIFWLSYGKNIIDVAVNLDIN